MGEPSAGAGGPARTPASGPGQGPVETVLLVDDQPIIGEAVGLMLSEEPDLRYVYCQEGTQAVSRAVAVRPSVILLDLVMPGVDGLDLVRALRDCPETREVPLVVLSSREEPVVKADAFRLGANDYLVKLPDPIELVARVRYHARSYRNLRERDAAYAHLREFAARLEEEKQRSERLLLNVLPPAIAERLKGGEDVIADSFADASVLFADIVDFTPLSAGLPAPRIVEFLNRVFTRFDEMAGRYGLEKIKTIGDAYLVVAGVPLPRPDHAQALVDMALAMRDGIRDLRGPMGQPVSLRIGIASGPVTAGVIGTRKFIFDLWGDTVNLASRMESHGVPGQVQVSASTRDRLGDAFEVETRGEIEVKGLGLLSAYLVHGRRGAAR